MSCSNCYNGCSQITSDQCVRYTGIDVPVLGIKNGDSLSYIEQALIEFLVSTLDGSGIKVDLDQSFFCDIFSDNLPKCGDLTVVDVLNTLVKTACAIQEEVIANGEAIVELQNSVSEINGSYNFPANNCLGTLPANPTTHDVVQAVVSTLCATIASLDGYVLLTELPTLIAQYLSSQSGGVTKAYDKMVPYVAYEYYGPISGNFDGTGAGIGYWEKVYLCNGDNNTPDKRGRVAVGVTTGMGGGPMSSAVNPGGLNPNYTLYSNFGSNGVQLTEAQMPSHTHANTATSTITPNPHTHAVGTSGSDDPNPANSIRRTSAGIDGYTTSGTSGNLLQETGLTVNTTITNVQTGSGEFHPNNQPAIGCYYIMYRP